MIEILAQEAAAFESGDSLSPTRLWSASLHQLSSPLSRPDLNSLFDPLGHAHFAATHSRTAGDGSWLPTMLEQKPRFLAEICTFEVTRCPLKQRDFKMHAKQKLCSGPTPCLANSCLMDKLVTAG